MEITLRDSAQFVRGSGRALSLKSLDMKGWHCAEKGDDQAFERYIQYDDRRNSKVAHSVVRQPQLCMPMGS